MNRDAERLVTTVACPKGHTVVRVTAADGGFRFRAPHVAVGAPSRSGDHQIVTDRRRYGGMSGALRRPTPGEFDGITVACAPCGTDFGVSLNDLWTWATAGRRRVAMQPRP